MTIEHKVNLGIVSRTLETLLERDGRSVSMLDRSTGDTVPVSPGLAASADGLLPVFLVAGDAVWRDATSRSFGVELSREPRALLGYRAHGVSGGPFNCLMLSMMEAIDLIGGPKTILVNDFDGLWRGIEADIRKALAPNPPRRAVAFRIMIPKWNPFPAAWVGAGLFGVAAFAPASAASYDNAPPSDMAAIVSTMTNTTIEGCLLSAASLHRLPPTILVILLRVEGGALGRVSRNTNDTVDIGPMQVNQTWLPQLARHWHASIEDSFRALRDNFCANVEGGAWILRQGLDEAHGDFWTGVGIYHSHDPGYQATYLRQVLRQALALQATPRGAPSESQNR